MLRLTKREGRPWEEVQIKGGHPTHTWQQKGEVQRNQLQDHTHQRGTTTQGTATTVGPQHYKERGEHS